VNTIDNDSFFLPEFCRLSTLFTVVVVAELMVFVLVISQPSGVDRWTALSLYSLFVQWITLSSCILLCFSRPLLERLDPRLSALICWLLILLVTFVMGELAYRTLAQVIDQPHLEFQLRNLSIASITAAMVLRYFYLQHLWRQRLETSTQARIQALQARIRPHFLFNSLNTITAMIRRRPREAESAVEHLAELFRASLSAGSGFTTLAEELRLTRNYLSLETLRLEERLGIDWRTDALPANAWMPQLILQPLLENAVYHGIEPLLEGGTVSLSGRLNGDTVVIEIRNPLTSRDGGGTAGNGMAQSNVRERLRLAFGKAASFNAGQDQDGYSVVLGFPYWTEKR